MANGPDSAPLSEQPIAPRAAAGALQQGQPLVWVYRTTQVLPGVPAQARPPVTGAAAPAWGGQAPRPGGVPWTGGPVWAGLRPAPPPPAFFPLGPGPRPRTAGQPGFWVPPGAFPVGNPFTYPPSFALPMLATPRPTLRRPGPVGYA